jgi:hypothetical protein
MIPFTTEIPASLTVSRFPPMAIVLRPSAVRFKNTAPRAKNITMIIVDIGIPKATAEPSDVNSGTVRVLIAISE